MVAFSVFSHWYFLKKRWNSGTHFDVQKYSHAKKVTWICHGISPWMRDCIIDCSRQNSVARMQFIQFFCNLLTLTYFDLFHKITTKTCYKSRRAADLAKHHDDPSKCQFLFHNSMVHNSETGLISMLQCTSMISSETPHRRTHPHNGFKFFLYENSLFLNVPVFSK